LFEVVLAVDDFVELEDYKTCDQGCGSSDGGDDLASNELSLVAVGKLDLVILGAQIAGGGDEVDVEVCVVVFLEFDRLELEAC
jgi:hypothetical protein